MVKQDTDGAGDDRLISFENLTGSAFNDILTGSTGVNTIRGGLGADRITGNGGADSLFGEGGADTFVFTSISQSPPAAPATIGDFVHGTDKINVSAIDANTSANRDQAFNFSGLNANVVARSITWYESGGNTIVQADRRQWQCGSRLPDRANRRQSQPDWIGLHSLVILSSPSLLQWRRATWVRLPASSASTRLHLRDAADHHRRS
jgi:hypothetical protein